MTKKLLAGLAGATVLALCAYSLSADSIQRLTDTSAPPVPLLAEPRPLSAWINQARPLSATILSVGGGSMTVRVEHEASDRQLPIAAEATVFLRTIRPDFSFDDKTFDFSAVKKNSPAFIVLDQASRVQAVYLINTF